MRGGAGTASTSASSDSGIRRMSEYVKSITEEPKYAENIQNWKAFWALEDVGRPLWFGVRHLQ